MRPSNKELVQLLRQSGYEVTVEDVENDIKSICSKMRTLLGADIDLPENDDELLEFLFNR